MDFLKGCILVNYDVFREQCGCKKLFSITHTLKNRLHIAGKAGNHGTCAVLHFNQLLQNLRIASAHFQSNLSRILRKAAVHCLKLCFHCFRLRIQGLYQRIIILAVLLRKRSINLIQHTEQLFLVFSSLGSDRFDQSLQFTMCRIHIRIDLRQRSINSCEALHDLFHAQAVGSFHIRKSLLNFRLCCRDICMHLIQLAGELAHLLVDILIGLFTPAVIFRLHLFIPDPVCLLQAVQQSGKLSL